MDELAIEAYKTNKPKGTHVLFFKTPFCGTCQLAEQLLTLTLETMNGKALPTFICRAEEWQAYIEEWQVESVPCLVFIKDGHVMQKLYAFESVTKLYELYKKYE
ncbi:thiol-disulfide isomerase/thioredoxin [Pullulanibacillus pueri]|uniref:Thioredoxin-like protein YusE n=1 Tax=Pullulanibacillus pueri TaxID=1437324 RepID=A0A8J2ZSB0_9BACL|nr:thioredoxin family protein [Pullulanibacillus pueri]MBM7680402.1 thiol-disulfide isomerase/thioredoxin [Pullulanibacillus pueri]GGH75244.1 thioredoxin-like protein YusE [Pullulanibacillus pueri]